VNVPPLMLVIVDTPGAAQGEDNIPGFGVLVRLGILVRPVVGRSVAETCHITGQVSVSRSLELP
jgi:hypothetical protein